MPHSTRDSGYRLGWFVLLGLLPAAAGCGSGTTTGRVGRQAGSEEQIGDADSPADQDRQRDDGVDEDLIPGLKGPYVRLGTIPNVKLAHPTKASQQEAGEIRQLIRALAKIESPDFGLSGTLSGHAFLPIEGMNGSGAMLLTNHRLESAPELRRLVELGPKSLPFLLAALDDKTPTKLVMRHDGGFGIMTYVNELSGNPVNETEQKILGPRRRSFDFDSKHIDAHTVTIGDVCLVAIGQIVGRSYQAVRYQPTACIMLNSPTHDAKLCRQVRDIWSSADAGQTLLDSLRLDYATEGIFNGRSLDGWSIGADLQVGAAMRLLFYYPAESAELIAERLDRLDVGANGPGSGSRHTPKELDSSMRQCVANGVLADEFVKAAAWCREPKIEAALLRIFERATDPDVVRASMRSVGPGNAERIRTRVSRMIDELAEERSGPFGDGYLLLVALGEYGGPEAKPIFRKYTDIRSVTRCREMCHALRTVRTEWAAELLAPLLDDQRKADGWTYTVNPGRNEPQLAIRICDEAAETISAADKSLRFELRGTHADLDRQIKVIKDSINDK